LEGAGPMPVPGSFGDRGQKPFERIDAARGGPDAQQG